MNSRIASALPLVPYEFRGRLDISNSALFFRVEIDVRENVQSSNMVAVSKTDDENVELNLLLSPGKHFDPYQ